MRGIGVGLIAALAAAASSGAMAQTAPAAIDWSGFYVSGFLGGTKNNGVAKTTVGVQQYLDATDARQIDRATGHNDLDDWRPSGGVAGGYSKQFGNVVVGIEGSANTLFLNEDRLTSETFITAPTAQFRITQSVSADWMATLRPRLGWAQDNWLGYVTGGIAATRLKMHTLYTDNAFSGYSEASKSKLVAGWSLGVGGEYALNKDWSLRADYLYTRFDDIKTSSVTTSTNNSGGALFHGVDLDTHGLFIGFTYRFN